MNRAAARSAEVLPGFSDVADYFALLKPRVMSLVVFTALVGLVRAHGDLHPFLGFTALLCIAIGAGASGALNMWWDADIDARMGRTRSRPIPAGRVPAGEVLALGLALSVASVAMLGLFAGLLSAGLLAFTIFFYAVIYTMWLKRWTAQNIVIGGAAGAFPPMIGWAAAPAAKKPSSNQIAAIRSACRSDYQKVCAGVPTGGAPALQCLEKNKSKVSAACQQAVNAAGGGGATPAAASAPSDAAPVSPGASPAAAPPPVLVLRPMRPREVLFVLRSACGGDVRTLCAGVPPGGGRIIECLATQAASLSPACADVLSQFSAR